MIEGAHSAHRSRDESCAMVSPIEMRGRQLMGLNLVIRHRGQWHWTCGKPSAANSSMVACREFITQDRFRRATRPQQPNSTNDGKRRRHPTLRIYGLGVWWS
jgi:hypothetical protein